MGGYPRGKLHPYSECAVSSLGLPKVEPIILQSTGDTSTGPYQLCGYIGVTGEGDDGLVNLSISLLQVFMYILSSISQGLTAIGNISSNRSP